MHAKTLEQAMQDNTAAHSGSLAECRPLITWLFETRNWRLLVASSAGIQLSSHFFFELHMYIKYSDAHGSLLNNFIVHFHFCVRWLSTQIDRVWDLPCR
jgi:hypothetical protein